MKQQSEMAPHELRVVAELQELVDKRQKLSVFISTGTTFSSIPLDQQILLRAQLGVMEQYEYILNERVNRF